MNDGQLLDTIMFNYRPFLRSDLDTPEPLLLGSCRGVIGTDGTQWM